jgi:glycosyltransferase involved in cell wall biosynthesis
MLGGTTRHTPAAVPFLTGDCNKEALRAPHQDSLRILLVSTAEMGGGAERSAWNLFKAYAARGHRSRLAVGNKHSNDPDVALIPNELRRSRWAKAWAKNAARLETAAIQIRGMDRLRWLLRCIGEPRRWIDVELGREDFNFPGTWELLKLFGAPDVVHCYNLHGGYFDLRALAWLSRRLPVVLDLRDAWLLTGHCAHSFDCERWKVGCGTCPDLTIYPAVQRDGTASNWQRKKNIYGSCRLYVATPSRWLMEKVHQSMLAPAIIESRVIPTGVDLDLFCPLDKEFARAALGLPQDARILLFVGNKIRRNRWKDHETMQRAFAAVGQRMRDKKLLFIGLGEDAPPVQIGNAELRFVAFEDRAETVARYYQASDLYLHAAKADTFPRAVLEALGCGTPVVATAVGGIGEQVKRLKFAAGDAPEPALAEYAAAEATGVLLTPGDATGMARAIEMLLSKDVLRCQLGANARKDAQERFDVQTQADRYLAWYEELRLKWRAQ